MKKYIYILVILFFLSTLQIFAQRESEFKRKRESAFKSESFQNKDDKKVKVRGKGPQDPGGGGWPIPISGGVFILAGGVLAYTLIRLNRRE